MTVSAAWVDIDWDLKGRQDTFIRIEHSVHRSAYGTIPVPISVIANGVGPTLLLIAGTHGDEYEGQVALTRLLQSLDMTKVSGRLIVIPCANTPAGIAGKRVSPLDDGNLNRLYGADAAIGPTAQIAGFFANTLFPMADYVLDIHSGGSSLNYMPTVFGSLTGDAGRDTDTWKALDFINLPYRCVSHDTPLEGSMGSEARKHDLSLFSTEIGGAGVVTDASAEMAERTVYRFMAYLDLYPLDRKWEASIPSRSVTSGSEHYLYAEEDGVFEIVAKLGEEVNKGQVVGYLHTPEKPSKPSQAVLFPATGIWLCVRAMGRVVRGDCLGHLAVDK